MLCVEDLQRRTDIKKVSQGKVSGQLQLLVLDNLDPISGWCMLHTHTEMGRNRSEFCFTDLRDSSQGARNSGSTLPIVSVNKVYMYFINTSLSFPH